MGKLYTIGHSTIAFDEKFLRYLNDYQIDYVVDVRSNPKVSFIQEGTKNEDGTYQGRINYNRDFLEKNLRENGIKYVHMGKWFGARQPDRSLYDLKNEDGLYCLNFEKFRDTVLFKAGLTNVIKGLNEGHNIALMCSEYDPIDCHRTIMVSRGFELAGIEINHIKVKKNGVLESHKEINKRILKKYIDKERATLNELYLQCEPSFMDDETISSRKNKMFEELNSQSKALENAENLLAKGVLDEELLSKAYIQRNKEIGWVLDSKEEYIG